MHAVIHLVGFLLLWKLAEVGEFTYDTATPTAGSASGRVIGLFWLLGAVLFAVTAGALAIGSGGWRQFGLVACIVSTPALVVDAGDTFAGLAVNLFLAALLFRARRNDDSFPAVGPKEMELR